MSEVILSVNDSFNQADEGKVELSESYNLVWVCNGLGTKFCEINNVGMDPATFEAFALVYLAQDYVITPKNSRTTYARFRQGFAQKWGVSASTLYQTCGKTPTGNGSWLSMNGTYVCVSDECLEFVKV